MTIHFNSATGKLMFPWEFVGISGRNYITNSGKIVPRSALIPQSVRGVDRMVAFLEYLTTSDTSSFTLRSSGTVDYEVDWGDGTVETLTTTAPTHTYSSAGEYTIKVTPAEGSTYRPYFNDAVSDTSIASVSGTGGSQLGTTVENAWTGASNMTSFSSDIDTSAVTNFTRTWKGCSGLTSFPLIDITSGTFFNATWAQCSGFTEFPVLDFSNATLLDATWNGCTGIITFPLINTSSVTNFSNAWIGCTGLTSFPVLDTSSATSFNQTWRNCSGLTSFPVLDTSSATNFVSTWRSCSGITTFPSLDFSNGTTFVASWRDCSSLTTFPSLDFSNGTNFGNSWVNCALTAQSIENILTSLDANGASNVTLGISGGTNAAKSTWSTAANDAYDNLITKGWTISYNA